MGQHRLSLPPADWPEELKTRFEAAISDKSTHQRRRLSQAFGRWLKLAADEGIAPAEIDPDLVERRIGTLRKEQQTALRQILRLVWPGCDPGPRRVRVPQPTELEKLAREIDRNWHRLPPDWQAAAAPGLRIDPDGLSSGILIETWAASRLKSALQRTWAFFDFCRESGLPLRLDRDTVRRRLDQRQDLWRRDQISMSTALIELQSLQALTRSVFPEKNWSWMSPAIRRLKTRVALEPTRNASRVVELTELKALADQAAVSARDLRERSRGQRDRDKALKRAHAALAIALLVNSPVRVGSLATLDLLRNFDPRFTTFFLEAYETKDRQRDVRAIPPALRRQLRAYLDLHRAAVAPDGEHRLFVGCRGKPLAKEYLSQAIGDLTKTHLKSRVTPHVIRNVVAGFIVSEAPDEARLASLVLQHRDERVTATYSRGATQIAAGRKLGQATERARETVVKDAPARPTRHRRAGKAREVRKAMPAQGTVRRRRSPGGSAQPPVFVNGVVARTYFRLLVRRGRSWSRRRQLCWRARRRLHDLRFGPPAVPG
ncbi:site-specific integrase [Tranquillimonas alkanivorans]|uniref:Tyr recombinase domain-containing protein n=1 Tax=Tranquillimonas alkanivorans TaxID=441119 RepID=A0A1I5VBP4_9RHOB|nr:site-specific integrase [Tranquillimonas alkanivorans]SFQ04767.1 hypothetical protein SAMN04488047_1293 [Tranquillimonas alkanivorans]